MLAMLQLLTRYNYLETMPLLDEAAASLPTADAGQRTNQTPLPAPAASPPIRWRARPARRIPRNLLPAPRGRSAARQAARRQQQPLRRRQMARI